MPLTRVALTREQAFNMQGELLEAFSMPDFQEKLQARWSEAGEDMVLQAKARQEVCLEVQGPIIEKYGFEASRKGVAMSVLAFRTPELEADWELQERNRLLGLLADPSKRGEQQQVLTRRTGRDLQGVVAAPSQGGSKAGGQPAEAGAEVGKDAATAAPTLDIAIGLNSFEGLDVPSGCTVGQWRQLMADGAYGSAAAKYGKRLACHLEEVGQEVGRKLEDGDPLPVPPVRMCLQGPASILGMLELGLQKKAALAERKPRVGDYRMCQEHSIGAGFAGACIYRAEHVIDGSWAAVKWPARPEEVEALREIDRRAPPGCLGIPEFLGSGLYAGEPYLITQLLGERLSTVFPKPWLHPMEARWNAMRIVGRLMVRRLENLHRCGYVHCDISPENILLSRRVGKDASQVGLYLVDFGLARPYPNGGTMRGDLGSAEWSSIRSADEVERRPGDDLESLSWVLMHGLFGGLPWIGLLSSAYADWSSPGIKEWTIKSVQRMKTQLLEFIGKGRVPDGPEWERPGADWQSFAATPRELLQFIRVCQKDVVPPSRPDYATLAALLGFTGELSPYAADEADRQQYQEHVATLR